MSLSRPVVGSILAATCAVVLEMQAASRPNDPSPVAETVEGLWVGAFELGKDLVYIRLQFRQESDHISLKTLYMIPGVPSSGGHVRTQADRVIFDLVRDSEMITFEGILRKDTLSGVVSGAGQRGTFGLLRWTRVDPDLYEDFVGTYELGPGHVVQIRRNDWIQGEPPYSISSSWLSYVTESGRTGRLYPASETTFFGGPTHLVPYPVEVEVTFVRNQRGEVTGLVWHGRGRPKQHGTRSRAYRRESVTFQHENATLAGTLFLPSEKGPHPAVVMVQGGGPTNRHLSVYDPHLFARSGVAVLVYDGRGTGGSTGDWREVGFEELADDAIAAVEFLRDRREVDSSRIGLWGFTDGGAGAASVAASRAKDVAFLILVAAPGMPLAEQYLAWLEKNLRADGFSRPETKEALRFARLEMRFAVTGEGWEELEQSLLRVQDQKWFSYTDASSADGKRDHWTWQFFRRRAQHDPEVVLQKVKCPVLAIWGDLDSWSPPTPNRRRIARALRRGGNRNVVTKVYPKADHGLWIGTTGGIEDFPRFKQYAPGYRDFMVDYVHRVTNE